MRATRLLAAALPAAAFALAAASPAFAAAHEEVLTSDTRQVGELSEEQLRDRVLFELRPAVLGVHEGVSGSFVEVPPPNVQAPNVQPPALPGM
jgi:hypothetical protein